MDSLPLTFDFPVIARSFCFVVLHCCITFIYLYLNVLLVKLVSYNVYILFRQPILLIVDLSLSRHVLYSFYSKMIINISFYGVIIYRIIFQKES